MLTSSPHKSALSFATSCIAAACLLASSLAHGAAGHAHMLPSTFQKGQVFLKISVNDKPDAWMLLDTGTTESIIDTDYAKTIGLKLTASAEAQSTFGTTKPDTFDTDTIHIRAGNESDKVVLFQSIGMGGMAGPDGKPAAGMLGRTFLAGTSIVIDYLREEVYFETPQPAAPNDVVMSLDTGIPIVQLTMAGQHVNALIDTGGTYGILITPDTAKALGLEALMAAAKPVSAMGHGGEQAIVVGQAPPFSIGGLAVHDMKAAYTTFGTATDTIGAGVSLGIGFLKKYKVTLNYVAKTIRFES
ncbi:hypothetical protein RugamoR64_29360 [Duganella rhizosphaerae]|uniref:pepsin/retropepsin-like aspartic protease family protein n=1 Tax=Duganella rhizosphaerae TaxID=2885763 RepID=UPI0030E7B8FC